MINIIQEMCWLVLTLTDMETYEALYSWNNTYVQAVAKAMVKAVLYVCWPIHMVAHKGLRLDIVSYTYNLYMSLPLMEDEHVVVDEYGEYKLYTPSQSYMDNLQTEERPIKAATIFAPMQPLTLTLDTHTQG